jgi:hypothetical protein
MRLQHLEAWRIVVLRSICSALSLLCNILKHGNYVKQKQEKNSKGRYLIRKASVFSRALPSLHQLTTFFKQ